jgi:uncharacterized protein YhbP (UPF0306 family)
MKVADKKLILDYLKSHKLMTLATVSGNKPWVATVYYAVDDNLNLYLVASPKTEHGQAAARNKNVACNIADSHQLVTDKKVGMQIQGAIERLKGIAAVKGALKMWHRVNPGKEAIINWENMSKKAIKSRTYKVTPKKIRFFNEELYGEKEHETYYLT